MKITVTLIAFFLVAAGCLILMSKADADTRPRASSQSSTKSAASVKPRNAQRQSMGSRSRTRSATPVAPQKTAQNAEKAARRQSTGQSATSIVGSRNQVTAAGPTVNVSTPSGIQQIPATPTPARSNQVVDARGRSPSTSSAASQQARLAAVTRTSASGKTTTLAASPAR